MKARYARMTTTPPKMRHVSRTHRVDLDWLFERVDLDSNVSFRYVNTKEQIVDILVKGSFTEKQWSDLKRLANICAPRSDKIFSAQLVVVK